MDPTREHRALLELALALLASRSARVRFRDTERSTVERTLDVAGLAFDPPRWLVAAWAPERASLRLLDVARVLSVRQTRRRARPPPAGFDALDFALCRVLDPDAGPPRPAAVRVPARWGGVASAFLPGARVEPVPGGALLHLWSSRPDVLAALAASLSEPAGFRLGVLAMPSPRRAAKKRSSPHEARLLGLAAWILDQPGPVSRARIYEAFPDAYRGKADAREKKFTRDKDALRRLGFNLETEELGGREDQVGYFIDPRSSTLPPLELSAEEAAAVWTAGVGALRLSTHPLRDELESALRKLVVGGRGLPPRAAATEDLAADGAGDDGRRDGKLLRRLADAWEKRSRVRVSYWRVSTGEVVDRDVDVYGWARRRGEWIFVGHCHLRKGVRIFYLSRVRGLKLVEPPRDEAAARARRGRKGDYDVPDGFDVRAWSRQQIWDYDVHPPAAAAVRLRGSLARLAKQLLPAADVTTDAAGARVARLDVRNLRGLVRQALAWGPEAEIVEPPEARAMAREILDAVGGRGLAVPSPYGSTP